MKKMGIVIAMLAWGAVAIRIISLNTQTSRDVITAFNSIVYDNVDSIIEAFGEYGTSYLDDIDKKEILVNIASCIGIDNNYDTRITEDGDNQTYSLYKDSQNAQLEISLNTVTKEYGAYKDCTQYISIRMTIKGRTDCAMTYKNMVEDLFDASGIDGYVNLNLRGEIPGALNYYERNKVADELLELLNASIVTESRENDLFTIYAYTDAVDEYVLSSGQKININIVQEYDAAANKTVIYLSTPLNNLDY